jgi:hypothetical protein
VARTAAVESNRSGTPEWVACAGMTRDVIAGRVLCPNAGWRAAGDCFDCRELLTSSHERSEVAFCELPEPEPEGFG